MSETHDNWQADEDAYGIDEEPGAGAPVRRRRVNYVGWLMSLSGLGWLIYFLLFIGRSIGWSVVPQLLPHELGGLIAGLLVPPAILFTLAVMTSRRQRLGDMLTALEGQVARLDAPISNANSELSELGEMLVLYGQALEEAVANARIQMSEMRGGFGRETAELELVADAVRALMIKTNETAGDQSRQLAQMTSQVAANLDEIRGIGQGEAEVIDDASRRASEVVSELVTTLRDQIETIEAGFQEAVTNTVGRVAGAGDTAADEIRAAAEQVVDRTQAVVDAVTQQVGSASVAIGDAGSQAAGAITQASDDALTKSQALGEELERRATDAGAVYEAAIAHASDKLAVMSEDAVGHADRLMQEISGQMDQTGAALDRVAAAMAGQMAQVTEGAGQQAREMTEAAASEMAQTAQALGASVTTIQQQTALAFFGFFRVTFVTMLDQDRTDLVFKKDMTLVISSKGW